MAMTWTSLAAPNGTAGSIASWVNYSKLDIETVIDEAQSLLLQMLRVREMRTEWTFGMAIGQANQALPARFLDPIGRLFDITNGTNYGHSIETSIADARSYEPLSGSFLADPFTTTADSSSVLVEETAHGLTQDSTITVAGAAAVGGITPNGAFPVTAIVDADSFTIDVGDAATSTATGGGSLGTYTANKLISGSPSRWTVWDERVKFDTAFDAPATVKLLYYRAPLPLSATNQSNWLTNRYPILMRKACQAAAADFMKDDVEYNKLLKTLGALIESTAQENDLIYRGAEFGTDTP